MQSTIRALQSGNLLEISDVSAKNGGGSKDEAGAQ
jgi:hypothetical protein